MKILIIFLIFFTNFTFSQVTKKDTSDKSRTKIVFLEYSPVIDGFEESQIKKVKKRYFYHKENRGREASTDIISYKLAYGTEFFYIFIEVETSSIIYRDRGYQNGDGVQLVLASPNEMGEATEEFYVLGFTPQKKGNNSWQKKFIWYRNKEISFKILKETKFETKTFNGISGYEILIPWSEIPPFHPWFFESIGFNICFVKAADDCENTYYFVKYDDKIQSEQSPRKYQVIGFEEPNLSKGVEFFSALNKNNLQEGERVSLDVATVASTDTIYKIYYKLLTGENTIVRRSKNLINAIKGLTKNRIPVNVSALSSGGYRLQVFNTKGRMISELPFTVLPQFDVEESLQKIQDVRKNISYGSYVTLLFKLHEIRKEIYKVKDYETAGPLRMKMREFNRFLSFAEYGEDLLKVKSGIFRRAYLSRIDSTLQPYSIKIPKNYSPDKKYPLLVFLHGSGQDDQGVLEARKGIAEKFIELAPYGRGTSNVYSKDHAQDDIREALNDVIRNYSIDTSKIILSGFSMGGYGVYRTFYETPKRFAALSVFSGHPNLANKWGIGGKEPNFLDEKYLETFKGMRIFIFHGEEDRNCPIGLTKKLVDLLGQNGAYVTAIYEKNKGHEKASANTMKKYYNWLEEIIK